MASTSPAFTPRSRLLPFRRVFAVLFATLLLPALFAADTKRIDVPAGSAEDSLRVFSTQSGVEVLFSSDLAAGVRTNEVHGDMSPAEALGQLLAGTRLVAHQNEKTGAFVIRRESEKELKNVNRAIAQDSGRPGTNGKTELDENGQPVVKLDTFEVFGKKTLNMDISRSRDAAQPYVVFNGQDIERSGAGSVEDFLFTRLPMLSNIAPSSVTTSLATAGHFNALNLRGLGASQTLILVDGHRTSSVITNGTGAVAQFEVSSIPTSAIERIEVLSTTSSGIYGGSATGGVINIILKRNYSGTDLTLSYRNTLQSDSGQRQISFNTGMSLESGRTNINFVGSYSDANQLLWQDRSFKQDALDLAVKNAPGTIFIPGSVLRAGATANISSTSIVGGVRQNLTLKFNNTPLNSPITYVPYNYAFLDNGLGLVATAGKYNVDVPKTGDGNFLPLKAIPIRKSLSASMRRDMNSQINVFVDAGLTETSYATTFSPPGSTFQLSASSPANPFNQNIAIQVPSLGVSNLARSKLATARIVGGVTIKLPHDWQAEADYTWNQTRLNSSVGPTALSAAAVSAAITSGALQVLRDTNVFPIDLSPYLITPRNILPTTSFMRDAALRAAGPLLTLPAGAISLSSAIEERRESYGDVIQQTDTSRTLTPSRSQVVQSAYLEINVPVFSQANHHLGLEDLEFQVAARYDRYKSHGTASVYSLPLTDSIDYGTNHVDSKNPTLAVKYEPLKDLTFRASYGTGFLPPSVTQLGSIINHQPFSAGITDPRRGNEVIASVDLQSGGNPALQPEESTSWSEGVIITPRFAKSLRISVDWTSIRKTNNIASVINSLGINQALIDQESVLPPVIIRGPAPMGDPFGVGPVVAFDSRLFNFAHATSKSVDFAADYTWETEHLGSINVAVLGTKLLTLESQFTPTSAVVSTLGTTVRRWRGNGSLTWTYRNWTVGWNSQYIDSVKFSRSATTTIQQQGADHLPALFLHDAFISYKNGKGAGALGFLSNTQVQLGVSNIFNRSFVDVSLTNIGVIDPALASYYISLKRSF